MVIYFKDGRLGNQLFQYVGLRSSFPDERIALIGFDALNEATEGIDAHIFTQKLPFIIVVHRVFELLLKLLAKFRLINEGSELRGQKHYVFDIKKGLIPYLTLVTNTYFQHSRYERDIPSELGVSQKLLNQGSSSLTRMAPLDSSRPCVFVHVRRGDYISFPTAEAPAVVPAAWYLEQIEMLRNRLDKPVFFLCTDDIPYCVELFAGQENVVITRNDEKSDFALMCLCQHGILSASSFAWWAAFFSRQRSMLARQDTIFLAPKFWAGHRMNEWYPPGLKAEWIIYKEVKETLTYNQNIHT